MKEFIDKLIGRLENKKRYFQNFYECEGKTEHDADLNKATQLAYDDAISIANQLAEESNNGWIPYTDKSFPKAGAIVDVWLTLEDGVYKAEWMHDHFEWENGRVVTDKIFAWKDNSVPKPYQPKGE